MFLKSLQLQGFKSFPDKTVLQFDRGATVVVGPNGSGKSNIADAMKWVLGELSSKNLRGSKMEDVIFGGTDGRGPMSFSEVSVTFDNSSDDGGQRLATDYEEVTVTRRYYRAGESEYMINRSPCRLKDIVELFMNTGIGREGYSIIGQGKIAEIISQKSEDRRCVFEEAAGISKYKYKKNEAQKKLLGVEENLSRVSDILSELTSRIGPLEKEAEKAKIYLGLYEQKKKTDISLWLYDMTQLKKSIETLSDDLTLAQNEYDRAEEQLKDLEVQDERVRELSNENKLKIDRIAAEMAELTEEKMRLENQSQLLSNEIAHIDEKLNSNKSDSASQESYVADQKIQKFHAEEMLQQMLVDVETAQKDCTADQEQIDICDREIDAAYARLKELDEQAQTMSNELTDTTVSISVLESSKSNQASRRAEIEENCAKYSEDMALLEERAARAAQSVATYDDRIAEITAEEKEHENAIAAAEAEKKTLAQQQNALFVDFTAKKERMDALGRMEELLEGYSRSVRLVMQSYESKRLTGATIYGPMSKLLNVDSKYATAIETALGAAIQNIVVQDDASAKIAIRFLKQSGGGRATFYPLNTMRAQEMRDRVKVEKMQGYIGIASELVHCEERFSVVVDSLLGKTVVSDNIDHANAIARTLDFKIKVVTLDGQVINAGGSFTGGSVKHDSGMLTRTTEIENLRAECTRLSREIDRVKSEIDALTEKADTHRDIISSKQGDMEMLLTLKQAEKTQQQVIENQLENDRGMLASLQEDLDKLTLDGEAYQTEYDRLNAKRAKAEKALDASRKAREETDQSRLSLSKKMTELQKQLGKHQILLAEANKDADVYRNAITMHEDNIVKAEEHSQRMEEENLSLDETRKKHREQIAADMEQISLLEQQKTQIETQRQQLITTNSAYEQKLAQMREEVREKTHTKELLFRQLTVADSKKSAALSEQDKKASELWEEYEMTFTTAQALEYPAITGESRPTAAKEQNQMRSRIKALGHVNVGAIEEYNEVKERYDFLNHQVEDLNTSKADLADIIYRLEAQMRTQFTEAMQQINREFKKVFSELFGGGHAELVLTEPDNVLESGVDIIVAPPGKIIKNLMLLSGGEQAFVAIALYFALQQVNPAPFCILDEIEAALDEVNVDKFASYLKHHSDKTQFIVITHRRGTMEIADRLYGVTMYEKGISVVLSINANEVGNFINK